jgi:abhydrolase domain-containing protein 6
MKKIIAGLILLLMGVAALLYLSPVALLTSIQLIERQRAELSLKQIGVNNLNIHYYEGGPSEAQTILMVHGFAALIKTIGCVSLATSAKTTALLP